MLALRRREPTRATGSRGYPTPIGPDPSPRPRIPFGSLDRSPAYRSDRGDASSADRWSDRRGRFRHQSTRTFITYPRLDPGTCRLYAYATEPPTRRPEHRFSKTTTDTDEHPYTTHVRPTDQHRLTHADRRRSHDGSRPRDVRSGLSAAPHEPDGRVQPGGAAHGGRRPERLIDAGIRSRDADRGEKRYCPRESFIN
jgi:hypothetical protein